MIGIGNVSNSRRPIAAGVVVVALAATCASANAATATSSGAAEGTTPGKAPLASAAIVPADGTAKARPDKGVSVTVRDGVLHHVTVATTGHGHRTVDGSLSADRKTWHTKWTLKPGTSYTVTAVAANKHGKATTTTSTFKTLKASSGLRVSDVTPRSNETVGVGMPIMVDFDRPVSNKTAVERAMEVRSTTPVEGAWRWFGRQQAIFRPKTYWPAHTKVTLVAHLAGVHTSRGSYGAADSTRSFKIGASHIAKVSLKKHKNKVYVDGKLAKTIPISGGMGGADSHGNDFRTTAGIHLAMGKFPQVWMTSPNVKKGEAGYYHELVLKDVQISNSGEYLHQSPGEYYCLGRSNCSHGCVRQSVSGAAWFFKIAQRGDVVDITGSSRKLEWSNGWGYWQIGWNKWVKGSALKRSVMTTREPTHDAAPQDNAAAPAYAPATPPNGTN